MLLQILLSSQKITSVSLSRQLITPKNLNNIISQPDDNTLCQWKYCHTAKRYQRMLNEILSFGHVITTKIKDIWYFMRLDDSFVLNIGCHILSGSMMILSFTAGGAPSRIIFFSLKISHVPVNLTQKGDQDLQSALETVWRWMKLQYWGCGSLTLSNEGLPHKPEQVGSIRDETLRDQ